MQPLVSIITPCYNGEQCIARLMDSVLGQTYDNIEFIIINDGSTDNSELIILQYQKKFVERGYSFKYYCQKNSGLGAAINSGLKLFTGEYLCWVDADDYLERESVYERIKAFEEHSDCAVITSNSYVRDYNNLGMYKNLIGDSFGKNHERKQFELLLNGDSIFCSGCHMIRTSAFLNVNPKREIYAARRGQNWQLLLPVYFKYDRFFLDKPLYNYIIYPNSMSKDSDTIESKLKRYEEHEQILCSTLSMIEEVQHVNVQEYNFFVKNKYAKLRMEMAIQYRDKKLFSKEFKKKMQLVGIDKRDVLMCFRNQIYLIDNGIKMLRKIRGYYENTKRKYLGGRDNAR